VKALSLHQPWASLVASGAKRVETRSWRTSYRGPLAVHASARLPAGAADLCSSEPFRWRLLASLLCREEDLDERPASVLPLGAVIAVTWIEDVVPVEDSDHDEEETAFGDFSPGRWAWELRDPICIAPVAARGHLGLWNLPDDLVPDYARRAIRHPGPG
jgi:hypothetical protein